MFIELTNNMLSYVAGQQVSGVVHVDLRQPFNCSNLTIGVYGSENVKFRKAHRSGKKTTYRWHYGEFPIINLVFPL